MYSPGGLFSFQTENNSINNVQVIAALEIIYNGLL